MRPSFKLFVSTVLLFQAGQFAVAGEPLRASGNVVTRWNAVAMQVLPVEPGLLQDSRAYAILHAAVHDAVNGVKRRYRPYTADLYSPGASLDAAVAAAARDVLVALSPSQAVPVEFAYAAALLGIADGPAKTAGIALGQQSAAANLARRLGDGLESAALPAYAAVCPPPTSSVRSRFND